MENEDLRMIRDELVLKVEKRDNDIDMREVAIEEAVGMICQLEARIEDLEQTLSKDTLPLETGIPPQAHERLPFVTPSTPPQIKYADHPDSPTSFQSNPTAARTTDTPTTASTRSPLRRPSFIQENKRSTVALRSLYASGNPSFTSLQRPSSIFSEEELDEDLDRQMLNSPRLSILSESGFSSIYGQVREQTASPQHEGPPLDSRSPKANGSPSQRTAQRQARISNWMEESERQERPKTPVRRSPKPSPNDRFSSIGEVLEKTPSKPVETRVVDVSPQSQKSAASSEQRRNEQLYIQKRSPTKSLRKSARAHDQIYADGGASYVSSRLPPTPDTMSTATIAGSSSTQSIITERSMIDSARIPAGGYASLVQSGRPRSSDSRLSYRVSEGLEIHDNASYETSDEELESTQVERSEIGSRGNEVGFFDGAPSFIGGSIKATRFFGKDAPVRPVLATHATDVIVRGDGYSQEQASRTSSYPSPTGSSRQAFNQFSPNSKRSSGVPSERTITSPRRTSPVQARSPASSRSTAPVVQDAEAQTEAGGKHQRQSSLRFLLPRLSSTSNTSGHQSVTSRIFGRSSNQASNAPETNTARPLSRHSRPSLIRPSSLYGQPSPSSPLKSMLPKEMLTDRYL